MVWLIAGGILICLAAGFVWLCFQWLEVKVSYSRNGKDDHLVVTVCLFDGKWSRRMTIPQIRLDNIWQGINIQTKQKRDSEKKNIHITIDRLQLWMSQWQFLKKQVENYYRWFTATLRTIRCLEFRWKMTIGAGDAPETAILTGMGWMLQSMVVGYLFRYIQRETNPEMMVEPKYNDVSFSTEIHARFKMKIGVVLLQFCLLLWNIMKAKGGLVHWWKLLFRKRARKQSASAA